MKYRVESISEAEWLKADSHMACRARFVPMPCPAPKGFECVFPV